MKKTFAFLASIVVLTACTPTKNTNTQTGDQSSSAMMEMHSSDMMMDHDSMMEGDDMMDHCMGDDCMMKGDEKKMDDTMKKEEMMQDEGMMKSEGMMSSHSMMMEKDEMMMDEGAMMKRAPAVYATFSDGVIGNGQSSILFFHAAWCPYCRTHDATLQSWYNSEGSIDISTYKIDYDSADELKARYGVVQQDTFVVIDGQGNLVKLVSFPSEADLKALIAS